MVCEGCIGEGQEGVWTEGILTLQGAHIESKDTSTIDRDRDSGKAMESNFSSYVGKPPLHLPSPTILQPISMFFRQERLCLGDNLRLLVDPVVLGGLV